MTLPLVSAGFGAVAASSLRWSNVTVQQVLGKSGLVALRRRSVSAGTRCLHHHKRIGGSQEATLAGQFASIRLRLHQFDARGSAWRAAGETEWRGHRPLTADGGMGFIAKHAPNPAHAEAPAIPA